MENLRKIKNEIDIIIYHYPCMDGFASFWVAQHYLKNIVKKEVIGIPKVIESNDNWTPLDENLYIGKNVLMVDILTKDYKDILTKAKNLVILDHHKTSKGILESDPNYTDYAHFNMLKSGVGLCWEYFFEVNGEYYERYNRKEAEEYNKQESVDRYGLSEERKKYLNPENGFQEMPKFLQFIQDRDLYTFKLERSKDFNEGLFNWLFVFAGNDIDKKIEKFNELYDDEVPEFVDLDSYGRFDQRSSLNKKIADMGQVLNLVKDNKIASIAKNTQVYNITVNYPEPIKNFNIIFNMIGKDYIAAIAECSHDLASDLGHYLVDLKGEDIDFAMMWRYDHYSEEYWYSLRSDDTHADVSKICEVYGGGGHRNASGFSSKLHPKDLFNYSKFMKLSFQTKTLVLFNIEGCVHCKMLEPIWNEVENDIKQNQKLDIIKIEGKNIPKNVVGVPTIRLYKDEKFIEYNGDRTKEDILKFAYQDDKF